MNPPKCDDVDYIHFLIAAQKVFTCTEAARWAPEGERAPAHDAFTRLLQRQPPDTEALWQEAKAFVDVGRGLWVLDDTTLDKPYAQKMDRVTYHGSGQHQRVVKGIALLTLLGTDGKALLPWDFRVYDKPRGGKTKNEHFQEMLRKARERGFTPEYGRMDSWYSSLIPAMSSSQLRNSYQVLSAPHGVATDFDGSVVFTLSVGPPRPESIGTAFLRHLQSMAVELVAEAVFLAVRPPTAIIS